MCVYEIENDVDPSIPTHMPMALQVFGACTSLGVANHFIKNKVQTGILYVKLHYKF